ncbi:MAG TPA: nuclear transport factor 2 family protein [Acidobacteriota bacterium]|nr:nuclear transport factor 2 family protein [Acidobacteriota bacterium]
MNWNPNDPNILGPEGPQKQKDSILLKVLIGGCGCLILIGVLFAIFAGKFFVGMTGPSRTVKAHIEAMNEGDYEKAYSHFSKEYKKNHPFSTFRAEIEEFPDTFPLAEYALKHTQVVNDKATVEGILTAKNGAVIPVRYFLVLEKRQWMINDYVWEPPGKQQLI